MDLSRAFDEAFTTVFIAGVLVGVMGCGIGFVVWRLVVDHVIVH